MKFPILRLAALIILAASVRPSITAISIPAAGTVVDFATSPSGADFASVSVTGGAGDQVSLEQMDNPATGVSASLAWPVGVTNWAFNTVVEPVPPVGSLSQQVRYTVDTQRILTGPTTNRYHALLGRFQNNAGSTINALDLSWALTSPVDSAGTGAVGVDPLAGIHVYYSLSGTTGSWTRLTGPHTTDGVVGPATINPTPLTAGGQLYIAWVDDNGPGGAAPFAAEGNYTVDDITISNLVLANASLSTSVSNVVRDDNTTPADPADDKVSFGLLVTGAGAAGATYNITSPAVFASTGNPTGVEKVFTDVPISNFPITAPHTLTGTVEDPANPGLTATFSVTAPWTTISVTGRDFVRIPDADPFKEEDTFRFTLRVSGQFGGAGWTSIGSTVLPAGGNYNVDTPSIEDIVPGNLIGPLSISDGTFPESSVQNIYILPPYLVGTSTVSGSTIDVISNGSLTTGASTQVTWANEPGARILRMRDGDREGAGTAPKEIYAGVNLAGAAGPVAFSMTMVARDTSSGFEAVDSFSASLVYNDGMVDLPPVPLIRPDQDPNGDGILTGAELVTANAERTFEFFAVIPDNIQSTRLVIRGMTDSFSEEIEVRSILFAAAAPSMQVSSPSNIQRRENGPGLEDDTLSFDLTLTGFNAGPGWTTSTPGLSPAAGAYGTITFTLSAPLPAGPVSLSFTDSSNAAITGSASVGIPSRGIIAQRDFGGGLTDVAVSLIEDQSERWVNDPAARTYTMNTGLNLQTDTVTSELLDLSAVGDVRFTGKLAVSDTSTGSNFESVDRFRAELIIDGGLPGERVINLVIPFDTGDGTPAVPFVEGSAIPNGAPDGWINGYTGTASLADGFGAATEEYNAHRARDEFNLQGQETADSLAAEFTFAADIPASASKVQVRISSQGIQGTESVVFRDAIFQAGQLIIPGNANIAVNIGSSAKMGVTALAALATGGNGPIRVSAVQTGLTGRGSSVSLQEGWIIYEPAAGIWGADTFTYTLTDGSSSVQGTVVVAIGQPEGTTQNIAGMILDGTDQHLAGFGIPGRTYRWEYSANLQNWVALGEPVVCPAHGAMSASDPGPLPPRRYYRLSEMPASP